MPKSKHRVAIVDSLLNREKVKSRLSYVCDFIRRRIPEIQFEFIRELPDQSIYDLCIEYSEKQIDNNTIHIFNSRTLVDREVKYQYSGAGSEAILFPGEGEKFDLFSAVFHTLMRTQEYDSDDLDNHGRFRHEATWQFHADCLHLPIVDIWIDKFLRKLENRLPLEINYESALHPTFDIDFPWLHKHLKPDRFVKKIAKKIFNLEFDNISQLLKNKEEDPYDVFDDILAVLEENSLQATFFLLVGGNRREDLQNNILNNSDYQSLLSKMMQKHKIGVHPSYDTSLRSNQLSKEIRKFTDLTGFQPRFSRQHYLRMTLPDTYKTLDKMGIKHDYTMGFAGHEGWRSGTSYPYFWYDLEEEKPLNLQVHPLQWMDMTMTLYREKSLDQSMEILQNISEKVNKYGGELTILWHNSFFYNRDEKWWEVFNSSLKLRK